MLAEKGVWRKGWDGSAGRVGRKRLWLWSSRAWMVHVGLEVARLVRVWGLRGGKKGRGREGGEEGKGAIVKDEIGDGVVVKDEVGDGVVVKAEEEKNLGEEKWWRDVLVNAAYAPMTMHWSVEDGVLAEPWLGALGLVAAGVGFRQAWRETI